jgi:hypothetical protein
MTQRQKTSATNPRQIPSRFTALKIGYHVALSLKPQSATMRCMVGQIEDIDDTGLRITLMDWFVGACTEYDFFVTWESITSALVCTPNHDMHQWMGYAGNWQTRMNAMDKETSPDTITHSDDEPQERKAYRTRSLTEAINRPSSTNQDKED